MKIILLSDKVGCDYYRLFVKKYNYDCIFSSDISSGFLDSIFLVLKSKFFLSLRGGGISTIAVFSNIPYLFIAPKMNESFTIKNKVAIWSNDNQVFYSENIFKQKYLDNLFFKNSI
jgi:hypothetical protein